MSSYIPTHKLPVYNIHQLLLRAATSNAEDRKHEIVLPRYMSDKYIITGIQRQNLSFIKTRLHQNPEQLEEYFYHERNFSLDPFYQHLYFLPMVGYSILLHCPKVLDYLLTQGCLLSQPGYQVDHKVQIDGSRKLTITKCSPLCFLYNMIEMKANDEFIALVRVLKEHEEPLKEPITVRMQTILDDKNISLEVSNFRNIWHFIEKRISRLPPSLADPKNEFMKHVYDIYNIDEKIHRDVKDPDVSGENDNIPAPDGAKTGEDNGSEHENAKSSKNEASKSENPAEEQADQGSIPQTPLEAAEPSEDAKEDIADAAETNDDAGAEGGETNEESKAEVGEASVHSEGKEAGGNADENAKADSEGNASPASNKEEMETVPEINETNQTTEVTEDLPENSSPAE